MKNTIRLPLHKTFNVRDLGGYPIDESAITKWGVFYRGGQISSNDYDIDLIYKYGIRTVIDLLDEGTPYVFKKEHGNTKSYLKHIGLSDKILSDIYDAFYDTVMG
jgi:hypothetical protein